MSDATLPPADRDGVARASAIRRAALSLDILSLLVTPGPRPFFPTARQATWDVVPGDAGDNQHIHMSCDGDIDCISISFYSDTNQWGLWPADDGPCVASFGDLTHLVSFAIASVSPSSTVAA